MCVKASSSSTPTDSHKRSKTSTITTDSNPSNTDPPEFLSIPSAIYSSDFQEEVFALCKPGKVATFEKRHTYRHKPCPRKAWAAQLQPSLCQGRTINVTETASYTKRELVEGDLDVLENWFDFAQFGYNWDLKGWKHVRFDTKKGSETFYHIVQRVRSVHFTRKTTGRLCNLGPKEFAEYTVDIVCLNPLATVHHSSNFKDFSEEEKQQLVDYVRCLPSRLKTDGYPVNDHLRKLCKQHIKQRLNAINNSTA